MDFHEILYLSFFLKNLLRKFQLYESGKLEQEWRVHNMKIIVNFFYHISLISC